ncbi:hypothetical protein ABZ468_42120 [Streptomyces sp. NPDC005708]|uniref:hypothetical protein n=1 Tax=Streptomyces sp. NPDC005708 TaxID=3154564 RepID=UPI0033D75FFF
MTARVGTLVRSPWDAALMGEAVVPEDHRRIMDMVRRAQAPVTVKQICAGMGMSTEPARSEAMRARS